MEAGRHRVRCLAEVRLETPYNSKICTSVLYGAGLPSAGSSPPDMTSHKMVQSDEKSQNTLLRKTKPFRVPFIIKNYVKDLNIFIIK